MKWNFIILGLFLSFSSFANQAQIEIQVQDFKGKPAPGVAVMAGSKVNVPFQGNVTTTDMSGRATFATSTFQGLPITLSAPGFPKITYFAQSGTQFRLKLPPPNPVNKLEILGTFSNWAPIPKGSAQFGVFYPSLRLEKMFGFNIADIISTTTDRISVMGQSANVPSNLVIPRQTVSYSFFSVTIEKPVFRIPVAMPETYTLYGLSGDFPVKTVVDKMRANSNFFNVINDLNLRNFGAIKNLSLNQSVADLVVPQNQGQLTPCLNISSSQAPQGLEVVSIGLVRDETSVDRGFQVTDFKKVGPTPVTLGCVANDSRPVTAINIGVGYHKEGKALAFNQNMSSIILRNVPRTKAGARIEASNYLEVPQIQIAGGGGNVDVSTPAQGRNSPAPQALYGYLADVTRTDMGDFIAEDVTTKWVVFAPAGVTQFELPVLPPELNVFDYDHIITASPRGPSQTVQRWDMQWLALDPSFQYDQQKLVSVDLGYDLFETMTHAARNAKDF